VVAVVVGALVVSRLGDEETPSPTASSPGAAAQDPATLAVLAIRGTDRGFVGVVGAGTDPPAAVAFPPGTTIVVPGQGETVIDELTAGDGDTMRVGVSNAVGAWIPHYLVTDLDHLAALVERAGGLPVDLTEAVTLRGQVKGPGETLLTGPQAAAYLDGAGEDAAARWTAVLQALLDARVPIAETDLLETDDGGAATGVLRDATGATVEPLPTEVVLATIIVPLQPDADRLVQGAFHVPEPARVLLQNGSGAPGVGTDAGRLLIPEGFRVILSQNAETFDHEVTEVIASSDDVADLARTAREALGAGLVEVAQVPSGLADVTIVIGKDFEG
jgi:hypothetical protein